MIILKEEILSDDIETVVNINPNQIIDKFDETVLHIAARQGNNEVVILFLEHISNNVVLKNTLLNRVTKAGYAALHLATDYGHIDVVKSLVKNGADVNQAVTNRKYTPLHLANEKGHNLIREFLIEHGADVSAKDNGGVTALDAARWQDPEFVKNLIQQAGIAKKETKFYNRDKKVFVGSDALVVKMGKEITQQEVIAESNITARNIIGCIFKGVFQYVCTYEFLLGVSIYNCIESAIEVTEFNQELIGNNFVQKE